MLFGVRVVVDSMRKSVSLNNLSQYQLPSDLHGSEAIAGYASADDAVHHSSGSRSERKRGIPWTEEEHKLFLIGLQKVGKGDWRGISRNFVKTRTPTQVASHAQKYFLRRLNINRRRRRSSLFDITTDTVAVVEDESHSQSHPQSNIQLEKKMRTQNHQSPSPPAQPTMNSCCFPILPAFTLSSVSPMPMDNLSLTQQGISANLAPRPPSSSLSRTISDVDLNLKSESADQMSLALNLSLPYDQRESSRHTGFQMRNGDSTISVA
ncbi:Transcription factor MYB1R1 [Linum perenne]